MIPPRRFWGHPDNWSEETWQEHLRIVHSTLWWDRFRRWLWGW